jgi:hypothetical protein
MRAPRDETKGHWRMTRRALRGQEARALVQGFIVRPVADPGSRRLGNPLRLKITPGNTVHGRPNTGRNRKERCRKATDLGGRFPMPSRHLKMSVRFLPAPD